MNTECNQSKSWFAPSGRVSGEILQHEIGKVSHSELITTLINAMPDFLMVLNECRQIVVVNQQLLKAFNVTNPEALLGLRPGEAVGCIHFSDGPDGCGTAKNCAVCGAVLAILSSQDTGLRHSKESVN